MSQPWWQRAVVYQIYPRSFADLSGDGIGDLDGIAAHLDYLGGSPGALGIDAIWLSPIYPSPMRDWGYDVSDYCAIHPEFGDLESFDHLLAEAHRRGIRVLLDLVPNHTSDQHRWFVSSRSSPASPKRDWYIWAAGEPRVPPNNWLSTFGGPAWEYDQGSRAWYLHSFLKEQPDLNYRNPAVVGAMHAVMRFWLDRGVDGFRIDVLSYLMKDARLRDNPPRENSDAAGRRDPLGLQLHLHDQNLPEVHDIVRGIRAVANRYRPERMLVGEVWPREQRDLADYLRPDELHLVFNFRFLRCRWRAAEFAATIEESERLAGSAGWPTYTLSNHDASRHITRYGRSGDGEARARVAAVMLMTLRGTPFLYYGEEIGMRDVDIPLWLQRDPMGRDRCRAPMQWSARPDGGFTRGEPWLPLGDAAVINVERQMGQRGSMLELYRRLIQLRKSAPALIEGSYLAAAPPARDCLVFERLSPRQRLVVALNFASDPRAVSAPPGRLVLSTDPARAGATTGTTLELAANEAVIVEPAGWTESC